MGPPKRTTLVSDKPDKSTKRPQSPGRGEGRETRRTSKSPARPKSPSRTRVKPEPSPDRGKTRRQSTDVSKSPTRTRSGHLTPTRRSPIRSSPSRLNKEQEKPRSSVTKGK